MALPMQPSPILDHKDPSSILGPSVHLLRAKKERSSLLTDRLRRHDPREQWRRRARAERRLRTSRHTIVHLHRAAC
eukprot:2561435-Pleurochrysis_carterae.AAC.2